MKSITFSGVQPSGNLHLGNYLGAIRNWVRMQADGQCIYCIVDLHAITVWQDPQELRASTRDIAATLLAAGIDPKKSIVFNQSAVTAHVRLAWIFNCVARVGWLNRMTQFKDKAGKDREGASVGLYCYPVLQAADILAYKATRVPVGEDQKQHIELARDIAQKFNHDFGTDFFPLPEPVIPPETARIMSLRDGDVKMSKSDPSDYSRINLIDDATTIAQKIRKARTDFEPLPETPDALVGRSGARNLLGIYAALSDRTLEDVCRAFAGQGFADFKSELADLVVAKLAPITGELRRLRADTEFVDAVLRDGAERARACAEPIVDRAEQIVGLLRP